MSLIGIDIGSTGCKVAVYSDDGATSSASYREYKVNVKDCFAELDSNQVWNSCLECMQEILINCNASDVKAICVSSMGDTFTLIGKDGLPLMDSIMSYDSRAYEECQTIEKHFDLYELYKKTGMPLHPMHPISKIIWLNKNKPELCEKVWKYLSYEDFILWKLGAEPCSSYSSAGRTMLFNNQAKTWDKDLMDISYIDENRLPALYPSGAVVGHVSAQIAYATGIPRKTKLISGGFDQACCAIACGVFEKGALVDTTGTNEILFFIADENDQLELFKNNFSYSYHVDNDHFSSFGHMLNAGGAFKWVRDVLHIGKTITYDYLTEHMPEEPTKLYFMPFMSGMGTPEMLCQKHAVLYGLSLDTSVNDISKAILEGVTYELNYNINLIHSITKSKTERIQAVGGAAKSNIWMQMKADITGITFESLNHFEPGTTGAAIIAGVGCGIFQDLQEGYHAFNSFTQKQYVSPDSSRHSQYAEKYMKYCELREYSKKISI